MSDKCFRNVNTYSFLAEHLEPGSQDADDEENDYPITVKIDLSQFKEVIQTNTHHSMIEKSLEPGECMFMFHAKIHNLNFKQPLKPTI